MRSLLLTPADSEPPQWAQSRPDGRLQTERLDPQTPWIEDFSESGTLPVSTIQKIIEWLS